MAYVKIRREDSNKFNDFSKITLRGDSFQFNSKFVEIADLNNKKRVAIHVDSENRKVGFEFLINDEDKDGFILHLDGGSATTGNSSNIKKSRVVKVTKIVNKFEWIKSVSQLKNNDLKKFTPDWNNLVKVWEITLMPTFEIKVSNQSQVKSDIQGIYRYLRKDGSIVYIGKGKIKSRLSSPERKLWDFDIIEYSILSEESEQTKWESFWLDQFVQNNGKLPFYNHISGKKEIQEIV